MKFFISYWSILLGIVGFTQQLFQLLSLWQMLFN